MPRTARIDAPGLLHHVRARGIERRKIYLNDADRRDFLERLELICADGAATIYAWSLMPNHFHLCIRTGTQPLATTMRRLLAGYANGFNSRYSRDGHLFQNRYKSTVVDEERYFLSLVRYIHLNPLRAKMVADLAALNVYPFTGHRVLMGKGKMSVQNVDDVLGLFGSKAGSARRELMKFMGDETERNERKLFKGGGLIRSAGGMDALREMRGKEKWSYDERILGSGTFVESVLKQVELPQTAMTEETRAAKFNTLLTRVAKRGRMEESLLTSGSRMHNVVHHRQLVCFIAVRHLGMSLTAVARRMNISKVAVLKSVDTGRAFFEKEAIVADALLS